MYKKVYLRDLECYKSASDEMKQTAVLILSSLRKVNLQRSWKHTYKTGERN